MVGIDGAHFLRSIASKPALGLVVSSFFVVDYLIDNED